VAKRVCVAAQSTDCAPGTFLGPIFFKRPNSIILVIAFFLSGEHLGTAAIDFTNREELEDEISADGAVSLGWKGEAGKPVALEQGDAGTFENAVIRYQGLDSGAVLTGLPEGIHYFRVGTAGTGEWSPPLSIEVKFIDRSTLFLLLGVGGLVACMTIGAIISGHFRIKRKESAESR